MDTASRPVPDDAPAPPSGFDDRGGPEPAFAPGVAIPQSADGIQAPIALPTPADDRAAIVPTTPTMRKISPSLTDLRGWQEIVEVGGWTGLRNEDIVEAYDHFRAVGMAAVAEAVGKIESAEYDLAFALRRQLARAALAYVYHYIPFDAGPRAGEYESARKTALEHMRAAIDVPTSKRGQDLRAEDAQFHTTARFLSKGALELEFGRKGNKWRDPKRRVSLDVDMSAADGRDTDATEVDSDEGDSNDGKAGRDGDGPFDRMSRRRNLEMQLALTRAIAELPSIDHRLIVLWSYLGYSASQIAPVFRCTEPTIAARLHFLAQSPHLKPFRK